MPKFQITLQLETDESSALTIFEEVASLREEFTEKENFKYLMRKISDGVQTYPSTMKTKNITDGYHTFDDLYWHRYALFGALCFLMNGWKSKQHSDGTMFEGCFIAGFTCGDHQQITYHMPMSLWHDFPAKEVFRPEPWDGHTPDDVVDRLLSLWMVRQEKKTLTRKEFENEQD